jgi:hypothetical protein
LHCHSRWLITVRLDLHGLASNVMHFFDYAVSVFRCFSKPFPRTVPEGAS